MPFTVYKNEHKEHKFWRQKNKKSDFYKNKKYRFNIDDIDVNETLVSKKELYGTKTRLNTLSDIMIMMLLNHYV